MPAADRFDQIRLVYIPKYPIPYKFVIDTHANQSPPVWQPL